MTIRFICAVNRQRTTSTTLGAKQNDVRPALLTPSRWLERDSTHGQHLAPQIREFGVKDLDGLPVIAQRPIRERNSRRIASAM